MPAMNSAREIIAALPRGQWYGSYGTASCPVRGHGRGRGDQNPSLKIYDRDNGDIGVHCFRACDWRDVKEELRRRGLLPERAHYSPLKPPKSPVVNEDRKRNQGRAIAIWRASRAATGSLVEEYLRRRGITVPVPPSIRFAHLRHPDTGLTFPVMIAGVQGPDGQIIAIHRTFLLADGRDKMNTSSPRLALGPIRGGAVRLSLAADAVALVEGIEDALAVQQMTDTPAWAVLGTSGFASVELPHHIRRAILAPDGDGAGDKIIDGAAQRLDVAGVEVRVVRPPRGLDWCDLLMDFEERAGIRQFDGEQAREEADRAAWFETLGRRP